MPDERINALAITADSPAPDDFLALDGTANGTRKLRASRLQEWLATRAPAGYLWPDGVTSNRGYIYTGGARENVAGAPLASIFSLAEVVPSASSTAEIWGWRSTATAAGASTANSLTLRWNANDLELRAVGATTGDTRVATWAGLRTALSGQTVTGLEVRIFGGTATAPLLRYGGTNVAAATLTTAGTPPAWLDASLNCTVGVGAYNAESRVVLPVARLNAHLTDAESEAWRITGRPAAWVVPGGSMAPLPYTSWINYPNASFDYDTFTGASTSGFTATYAGGGTAFASLGNFAATIVRFGRYVAVFNLTLNSGQAPSIRIGDGAGLSNAVVATPGANVVVLDFYYATRGSTPSSPNLNFLSTAATSFSISGFAIYEAGALSLPGVQAILALDDLTAIGDNCARLVGMEPIPTSDRWRFTARTHLTSLQDVQLLGGPIFRQDNRSRIDSIACVQNSGGALNIQLGSSSGGADIVASTSVASGTAPTELAPALRYPPTQNLWCRRVAGAGLGPFTFTLEGHRVATN